MPANPLTVAATTLTIPASVPAWVVSEDHGSHSVPVATFTGDRAKSKANAHLFAAAVDLLAACELADVSMDTAAMYGIGDVLPPEYRDSWVRAHRALQAAIAKAKGGAA